MNATSFVQALTERDELISRLREYAKELENLLVEKRSQEAAEFAAQKAWNTELEEARYVHGLRIDLTVR